MVKLEKWPNAKIFRFVTVTTGGKRTHSLLCSQIKLSSRQVSRDSRNCIYESNKWPDIARVIFLIGNKYVSLNFENKLERKESDVYT